jgi:hypothetical protein
MPQQLLRRHNLLHQVVFEFDQPRLFQLLERFLQPSRRGLKLLGKLIERTTIAVLKRDGIRQTSDDLLCATFESFEFGLGWA